MKSRDVPQWLVPAFVRSARAAGATAPVEELEATARSLIERWSSAERHFHTVRHLVDTLARVDELASETHHPDLVRLAVWYHGAVFSTTALKAYARSAGEDKEASAQLAIEQLGELGVSPEVVDRVAHLILSLKRHQPAAEDIDAQVICDADLGTVAANPQKYRAYRQAVREEFTHLPLRHVVEARIKVVTRLLERRNLFLSPLARAWEEAARENLTAELARLETELESLGECHADDHLPTSPDLEAEDAAREARKKEAREREGRPVAEDETPTGSMRRVAPIPTLPVPPEGRDEDPYVAEPVRETGSATWGDAVARVDPTGEDLPGSIVTRSGIGRLGEAADHRSSLETGPEALFAALGAESTRAERERAERAERGERTLDTERDDSAARPERTGPTDRTGSTDHTGPAGEGARSAGPEASRGGRRTEVPEGTEPRRHRERGESAQRGECGRFSLVDPDEDRTDRAPQVATADRSLPRGPGADTADDAEDDGQLSAMEREPKLFSRPRRRR